MVEYWDRLKSLMGEGWDAARLAKELGVSYQAVKKVRDGGSFGSINNLKAAKLFGVNPEWLASGKKNKCPGIVFPALEVAEEKAEYSIKPSEPEQTAVNSISPWMKDLIKILLQTDPETRVAIAGLLSQLAKNPDNQRIIAALSVMTKDATYKEKRYTSSYRISLRPTEEQLGWGEDERRIKNRRA